MERVMVVFFIVFGAATIVGTVCHAILRDSGKSLFSPRGSGRGVRDAQDGLAIAKAEAETQLVRLAEDKIIDARTGKGTIEEGADAMKQLEVERKVLRGDPSATIRQVKGDVMPTKSKSPFDY